MRPSAIQRWLFELINLVLTLCFTIPVSALLSWAFHYEAAWLPGLLCLTVLGHLAGRLTMRAEALPAQLACLGSVLLAAGGTWLLLDRFTGGFSAHFFGNQVFVILSAVLTVAFFFSARRAGYTIYAPLTTLGLVLHLLSLIIQAAVNLTGPMRTLSSTAAIVFFLLSLYAFNARGLRQSVYTKESARRARLPRGSQMTGFLLVSGFILLAVLLSWIGPAIPAVAGAIGRGVLWVIQSVGRLLGLIDELTNFYTPTVPEEVESENGLFDDIPVGDRPAFENVIVILVAIFVVIVLLVVLLNGLHKRTRHGFQRLRNLLHRLHRLFEPEQDEDYVDEEESLFSLKEALEDARGRLRDTVRRVTQRPQRFDDFQSGRIKIRFVYQQLLKRRLSADDGALSRYQTPNELQTHLPPEAAEVIASYNGVRYGDAEPDAQQLAQAKALLSRRGIGRG